MSHDGQIPELMSPAGHWPQLEAAIKNGADAVYFGLNHFSARAKVGFQLAELDDLFAHLHAHGVKGFVTFNTLIFDDELGAAEKAIEKIAVAKADAIIVQDVGIAQLVKRIAPHLSVHGSTQMSVTSAQGAKLAKWFGCERVVLARELSLKDIDKITSVTDVELETFVHGALCVSYSGQCFSSEAWGGRSANRGQCAQACRLSYDLLVDGQKKELGEFRYLLSPGDLYALEQVPQLIDLGISCLKIEGRYKDENYVALTTRAYRQAIDQAIAARTNAARTKSSPDSNVSGNGENLGTVQHRGESAQIQNAETSVDSGTPNRADLEQVYSRGLGPHFISGINHQVVVDGRVPRHRGVLAGSVVEVLSDSVTVRPQIELTPGAGLVFDSADWRSPDEPEEGGSLFEVLSAPGGLVQLYFQTDKINFQRIREGDLVWRTHDPALQKKVKRLDSVHRIDRRMPLHLTITGRTGSPLVAKARLKNRLGALIEQTVQSEQDLQSSQNRPLTTDVLQQQLGRLGQSHYRLEELDNQLADEVFLPVRDLNEMRRNLVTQLDQAVQDSMNHVASEISQDGLSELRNALGSRVSQREADSEPREVQLHLLVRSADQLDAAIKVRPASITLDYLDLYGLRPSVEKIRAAGIVSRVASPRVLKPAEQNIVRFLCSLDSEILVRSGGLLFDLIQLEESKRPRLIGDFSLNAANQLSVMTFLNLGVDRIVPTYDLNAQQIAELADGMSDPTRLEVPILHHLAVFHTEHCVFCRFLSDGTDSTNCGHPCEKHRIGLRDSSGRVHPVMADVGCRNTVFGDQMQWAGRHLERWTDSGIRHFRMEFVHESGEQILSAVEWVRKLLAKKVGYEMVGKELDQLFPGGVTAGSLFIPEGKELVQISL